MSKSLTVLIASFFCVCNSACLQAQPEATHTASPATTVSPKVLPASKPKAESSALPTNKKQVFTPSADSVDLDQLQKLISDNLGDLLIVKSYKPTTIEIDFDSDGFADLAVVVGAKDRFGDENKIGDLFSVLAHTSEGLTFQNLRLRGILFAKPRLSGIDIEKNKSKIKPQSNLGLLIILSGGNSWKEQIGKITYSKKFLLLDAVFEADFEDKNSAPDMLSRVEKGDECLPSQARGEGIFSGDRESGGKVIYFNGKSFNWTQCGD